MKTKNVSLIRFRMVHSLFLKNNFFWVHSKCYNNWMQSAALKPMNQIIKFVSGICAEMYAKIV